MDKQEMNEFENGETEPTNEAIAKYCGAMGKLIREHGLKECTCRECICQKMFREKHVDSWMCPAHGYKTL